jgi:hypothetical protein
MLNGHLIGEEEWIRVPTVERLTDVPGIVS